MYRLSQPEHSATLQSQPVIFQLNSVASPSISVPLSAAVGQRSQTWIIPPLAPSPSVTPSLDHNPSVPEVAAVATEAMHKHHQMVAVLLVPPDTLVQGPEQRCPGEPCRARFVDVPHRLCAEDCRQVVPSGWRATGMASCGGCVARQHVPWSGQNAAGRCIECPSELHKSPDDFGTPFPPARPPQSDVPHGGLGAQAKRQAEDCLKITALQERSKARCSATFPSGRPVTCPLANAPGVRPKTDCALSRARPHAAPTVTHSKRKLQRSPRGSMTQEAGKCW